MTADLLFGYPFRRWELTIADRSITILGPANEEDLLESAQTQARFDQDEYLPYWGQLWPASVMLAEYVLNDELGQRRTALEIGCGLGLVAVAARLADWEILATDYDEDALRFTQENARLNGLDDLTVKLMDWRYPLVFDRFDRILAADVLYERRHHDPVAQLIRRLLARDGVALVADPNRQMARGFDRAISCVGLTCEQIATHANQPYGRFVGGTIYRIGHASGQFPEP